eukprot:CAMPEP_0114146984 /NCGR_PEP_ID=MMETSP0043_2-20121206/20852_1 /TAXON_ID=464988 /ORGANISM="Hemiselmis andersenii, Strain CCMP644" /LENGTH=436 /DNA_ID=CAMNT_0001241467 /DNA_START=24 /DNA_END=1334 /DNA_ORIENTATION=+
MASTDAMVYGRGAESGVFADQVLAESDGEGEGCLDRLRSMQFEDLADDDTDTWLSNALPVHRFDQTSASELAEAAGSEEGELPPTPLDEQFGNVCAQCHTSSPEAQASPRAQPGAPPPVQPGAPPRAQPGASPPAQPGVGHGVETAGDGGAAAPSLVAAEAAMTSASVEEFTDEAWAHEDQMRSMAEEEQARGGVKGEGEKGGAGRKRARGEDKPKMQRAEKKVKTENNNEEGLRLAEDRAVWKRRRRDAPAKYEDMLAALSHEKRQGVHDAMTMITRSDKHWCMNVEMRFLMAMDIVYPCDTEGKECPLPATVSEVGKKGERRVLEPREHWGPNGKCAFGGILGVQVRPDWAVEFLYRWAELHGMKPCPESARPHTLGFSPRDWETMTEGLSNQKGKFGLLPKPTNGDGYGGQFSWTRGFCGLTPMVYRARHGDS